jgi:hypothetical protein
MDFFVLPARISPKEINGAPQEYFHFLNPPVGGKKIRSPNETPFGVSLGDESLMI